MTKFLPALSVLFAVVATAVPWGLPADATFILPLVVVMMVFCWRAIPGAALPPAAAAGLGLLADLMSGGPLGYWALMSLIGATVGGRSGSLGEGRDFVTHWLIWIALVEPAGLFRLAARLALLFPLDRLVADCLRRADLDGVVSRGAVRPAVD